MSFEDRLLTAILDRHATIAAAPAPLAPVRPVSWPPSWRVLAGAAAVLTGGVAAGVGVGIAVLGGAPSVNGTSGMVLDANVVATRTIQALGKAAANSIEYTRERYLDGTGWLGLDGRLYHSAVTWSYGYRTRQIQYLGVFSSPDSDTSTATTVRYANPPKAFAQSGPDQKGPRPTGSDVETGITVNYIHRVWFPVTYHTPSRNPLAFATSFAADQIRQELQAGQLKVTGRVGLNGRKVIEVAGNLPAKGGALSVVIWIDPATYLPLQQQTTMSGAKTITEFAWLAPTEANLAQLTAPVPPGFIRLAGPPPYDR